MGPTKAYEAYLSSQFPGINFTVTAKADSKFKIVGAASVAAKVTRDGWVEGWVFEENLPHDSETAQKVQPAETKPCWGEEIGSGYPSDPKTQAWIKTSLEPTFGFPSLVRFSWTTIKVIMDSSAHAVEWSVP